MKKIHRYILRNLLIAFFFTAIATTAAIWVTQALRLVDLVVNTGAPFGAFAKLMLLSIPSFLGVTIPIALAAAIVFTYNKLLLDSELVVMRSAGLNALSLALPALVLSVATTLVVYYIYIDLSPSSNREMVKMRYALKHDFAAVLIREGAFNDISRGFTIYIEERNEVGEMRGLLIHDVRDPINEVIILAERGIILDRAGDMRLVLEDGVRQEFTPTTGAFSELHFERYALDVNLFEEAVNDRFADPRERSTSELLNPPKNVQETSRQMREFSAEAHTRFSVPLITMAFGLIALSFMLGGEFSRRGQSKRIIVVCCVILALQGASFGLIGLANKNLSFIPILYAVHILPMIPAIWLLARR